MDHEEEHQRWHGEGELVKFMILVAVLLLSVLLIAAARPLVFGYIVPAAMGWSPPLSGPLPQDSPPAPAVLPLPTVTETPGPSAPAAGAPAAGETLLPAATVTPLPTATPHTYQVKPGDNLTTIARSFGITVEALASANNISNPNRLMPGDMLLIPPP